MAVFLTRQRPAGEHYLKASGFRVLQARGLPIALTSGTLASDVDLESRRLSRKAHLPAWQAGSTLDNEAVQYIVNPIFIAMHKTGWLLLVVFSVQCAQAQQYAMLIKGGHVIDPKNNINAIMDIAVHEGRIVSVAKNIDIRQAKQVVNATGLYVTPGLIDMHTHVFHGTEPDHAYSNGMLAVPPDVFAPRAGITTVVDAGGAGWRSFPLFKKQVIDNAGTRVLAMLNIAGEGMRGYINEQNTADMDAKMTALVAKRYPEHIVGIKVAHYMGHEWTPVEEAVKAGQQAGIPVMIDFGSSIPPLSIEELFTKRLRPGDIFTHCFGQLHNRESIVDTNTRQLKPFVQEAQQKGIVFDVGYGELSFSFSQAIPALKSGFYPNSISSDIHARSMNGPMKDLLHVMSTFMAMGMPLQQIIKTVTWNPAQQIKHEELGHLSVGALADITILRIREGAFGFYDRAGYKIAGRQMLECEMTIRGGKIVYDLNGLAVPVESK